MDGYIRVIAILDQSIGGPGINISAHGAFWRGLSRDQFVAKKVFSLPLVVVGKGAESNLVKALKGQPPFGADLPTPPAGANWPRMPADLPPVPDADIAFIEKWIDDGCPAGTGAVAAVAAVATPPTTAPLLTWRRTNAPFASSRTDDIWFLDPMTGWAVNSNGHILKTTDGGASWTRQFAAGPYLRCVGFSDAQHGFVGTLTPSRRLFSTSDGGQTWNPIINLPSNAPARICGISVVNRSVIYASGTNIPTDAPRMMKSTDGGQTWTAWEMRPWASILIDTRFIDDNRGWVVGGKADDPAPQDRNEIKPVVLFTEDGGRTWSNRLAGQEADFPFGEWGWKIQFLNDRVGFVSLENFTDAAILKTSDGGLTWTRMKINDPQGNANLEGIGFIDELHGWVGGWGDAEFQSGFSSATDDGGTNWRSANAVGKFLNRFRFFGDPVTVGYASGDTVYKYSAEPVSQPAVAFAASAARLLLPDHELTVRELPARVTAVIPAGTARFTLDIWDRFGQHIGAVADETRPAVGSRTLLWDGRDASGRTVPDGAYILRLTADDEAESAIVVVRTGPVRRSLKGIRWVRQELRLPASSPLRNLSALATPMTAVPPADQTGVLIDIPDLSTFPRPIDKASFLLHAVAEIEHALLVQYLYAAYSLKKPSAVADPQQRAALKAWTDHLIGIVKEEMGQLLTVQNLRLLVRQPIDLEREDLPQPPNVYPFTMQLQPLRQSSLAKYVVAESLVSAAGIEDIIRQASDEVGAMPNRVGVLYALLGVVFTKEGELATNAQGGDPWFTMVRDVGYLAFVQEPDPFRWHLPEDAFDAGSRVRQATAEDWAPGRQIRVLAAGDRREALLALGDVALQGEGRAQPVNDSVASHFDRFLSIYRGGAGILPFPAAGLWGPSLDVPTNPKLDGPAADANVISSPRAADFARFADLRYALLLGFLEQYYLTEPTQRGFLVGWSFEEMKNLRILAGILTGLPRRDGQTSAVAALTFTCPTIQQLAANDPRMQWQLHIDRLNAAVALAQHMLATHSPGDSRLGKWAQQDQDRLQIAVQAQGGNLPAEPGGQWRRVRRILESAAGFGSPLHDGRGRFWNVPLTTFIGLSILGQDLIAPPGPNRGLNSNLVKALKGEVPFDGSDFPRMPLNRQPVAPEHIAFIQDWIDRGCPEE